MNKSLAGSKQRDRALGLLCVVVGIVAFFAAVLLVGGWVWVAALGLMLASAFLVLVGAAMIGEP